MKLYTRQSQTDGEAASILLGGIRIVARTEVGLTAELDRISGLILAELNESDWSVRSYVKHVVCKNIDSDNADRIFSGVFGRLLAIGDVSSLNCLSRNGAYYETFYTSDKEGRVADSLQKLVSLLMSNETLQVSKIRDVLFPTKPKASWPKTSLLIDAIKFVGLADWSDKFSIHRSEGMGYAIRSASGARINTGRQWLVV